MIRIFATILSVLLMSAVCMAAPIARISKLNGSVQVLAKKAKSYKKAKADQQLEEGTRIKTGKDGWVEIKLIDDSRITLANNTELELTSLSLGLKERRGVLNLAGGKLRATVTKLAGKQTDFKVKSPTAVAGIKGTEFLMLSRGPANVFFGNEGTVGVSGSDGIEKPLSPQMMTQTTRGYQPVDPVKVEPESPLATAKAAFEEATATAPPADWAASNNLPNIIARWNINYGHYLADKGEYGQALQVFQIALDLSTLADISADAHLERGTVFGRFLSKPQEALDEYLIILKDSPEAPQAETALFQSGQIMHEMGKDKEAADQFRLYLQRYPDGKFRSSAETLLNRLQAAPPETKQ